MLSALGNKAILPARGAAHLITRRQQDPLKIFVLNSSKGGVLTIEQREADMKKWPGVPEHVRPNYIPRIPIDPFEYDACCDKFGGQASMWKWATFLIAVPAVVILTYLNLVVPQDHKRPEFKDWDHLRPKMKFPWGDGKHSLFHNKWFNPIRFDGEGYETTDEEFAEHFHGGHHEKH